MNEFGWMKDVLRDVMRVADTNGLENTSSMLQSTVEVLTLESMPEGEVAYPAETTIDHILAVENGLTPATGNSSASLTPNLIPFPASKGKKS